MFVFLKTNIGYPNTEWKYYYPNKQIKDFCTELNAELNILQLLMHKKIA